ncbi:unnamed protein product [Urochloa humidicola]
MPRPRRPVPNAGVPSAVDLTGYDAPSAVSDIGVDLLHHSTPVSSNIAMASGGGSWTNLMSEQTDVDQISLSMPLDDIGSNQTKAAKAKRARNYTHEEDIQLCVSWENISTDPIIANEQPGMAYWKRIADHYHKHKTFESDRNANSLEHRWSTIQKECMRFQALYDDVERRHPSGIPYKEHILLAQTTFASTGPKKPFQFVHCWLKVRHCQKFLTLETNKRPWSRSSTPSEGGTEEEGDGNGRSENPDSTQPRPEKRPIGRKQAKERLKTGGDAGPYKEAIAELLLDKKGEKKLRDDEKRLKEERWKEEKKLKDERWKETRMMQQQKLSLEREKFMWEQEQKIMFCDVNTLDPDQKTYVLTMRAQIAAQKMAAFNSYGGASTGGLDASTGGSGGDVDEAAQ